MSAPLRIGVQLPEVERAVGWPEYLAIARAAEEVGFDSVWLGDHLLYREPERGPWEAWTTLAALAAATERVTLGPLVACTAFHPPGVIAKMAATVAAVSDGRFVLALGAGWNREDFVPFGLPYEHRVSRFEEAFTIIRRALAGERVTLRGRYHAAEDLVLLPAPPSGPPKLVIGSNGPRMLGIALPHADGWNTWYADYGNTPEGFAALNATISEAAERAGRDPAAIDRSACLLVRLDPGSRERTHHPEAPAVTGTDEEIVARVLGLAQAGADEVILVCDPITEASVRRLGPALAALR